MPDTVHFAPPGPLGFGGAPLGNMFTAIDEATAEAAMQAAWDSGIRYYDTAPHYGAGLSEHRFGHVLRQRPRDEFVLSTKVGRLQVPDREARAACRSSSTRCPSARSTTTRPTVPGARSRTACSGLASRTSTSPISTTSPRTPMARPGRACSTRRWMARHGR
ncbi:aldo/keto reductase [Dankookia sp. P2]|uniref:aldo/keto reductase n=1 Tax=Dankookia sp. P2 TaxID=3423955 RepID=UPI003D67DC94